MAAACAAIARVVLPGRPVRRYRRAARRRPAAAIEEETMQYCRTGVRALLIATAALALASSAASAQNWPSRFVTVVVSFPAGGPTDVLARAIAADLADKLSQQIVVENRSGAGGNVGAASVAKAAPDGHTLLFATTSVVNNRFMYKSVPFDADRDFVPIVLISKTPIVLVASQATGLKRLDALIARAKADPGKLNIGSPGHGTAAHITAESLQRLAGFKLTHVPYRGSAPMIADLLGNQIDVVVDLLPTQIPLLKEGKYAGIALTSSARSAALPDLPTVAESGFPGFEATSWNALLAPAGTPPDVVRKLNTLVNAYLTSEKGRQDLAKFDMQAGGGSPEDLKAFMASEVAKWGPIFKAANITME
jgi:tripartite-type tricarboxylate transporter receptor subunit TctC